MTTEPDALARLARRSANLVETRSSRVYRMSWWTNRILDWAMAQPDFKVQPYLRDSYDHLAPPHRLVGAPHDTRQRLTGQGSVLGHRNDPCPGRRAGTHRLAGGPDYLHESSDAVAISENTMRQGFAPDT